MIRKIYALLIFSFCTLLVFAREGMWIPVLLDKNMKEMQQMGFKLSADDIYSVNHSSMKDGIVLFGRGCTGELISPDGLLVTNHHCGFGQIQSHSSLEQDYLTDGFWAMNRAEELPNEDLTVTFLIEMRDVTTDVLAGTDSLISENAILKKKTENIASLEKKAIEGTHYEAKVKPFYNENQYFLFITEKYTDVRLVGAPPSAIGKFGGDTDNWMWPRHTGDFSLFRIYADSLNQPASYSPSNVPFRSKKYFPINISGIKEGDFTMVFGYPGTTTNYLHSAAIKQIIDQRNPDRISIRDTKLKIMDKAMNADREIRIQYAAKYASTSNSWKKWQGELLGLKRMNAVEKKLDEEKEFAQWVVADATRKYNYGNVLSEFERYYNEISAYQKAKDYFDEVVLRGTDACRLYSILNTLPTKITEQQTENERRKIESYFKDFNTNVDLKIFVELMKMYKKEVPNQFLPKKFVQLLNHKNAENRLSEIYSKSLLNSPETIYQLLNSGNIEKLKKKVKKDKLCGIYSSLVKSYKEKVNTEYNRLNLLLEQNQKFYMAALLEMKNNEMLYPDANLTLRVSYGKVEGFVPADGVNYRYYSTLEGIIEKDNPDVYDYRVPQKLKELYAAADYGNYANEKGEMPVCFTASNHTSGGNSGSPVIDANGNLIGINFDRAWEGTMSDILFDPEKCRNISLDMRYMLFLIDKYAGAGYLIDEMEILTQPIDGK